MRDLVIAEVQRDSSTLVADFIMSLTEHVTRLGNVEQQSRSKALACLKDGITAMLEERVANVNREERMARVQIWIASCCKHSGGHSMDSSNASKVLSALVALRLLAPFWINRRCSLQFKAMA